MLILDTHAWVWLVSGNRQIGPDALREMESAAAKAGYVVPAIAVWELAMLVERGRLTLTQPLEDWIEEALSQPNFELAGLTPNIAIRSARLAKRVLRDPADRMIVATAIELGGRLATRDREIIGFCNASGVEVVVV